MEEINELVAQGWMHGTVIIEILGSPGEHVKKTLATAVDHLKEEKYLQVREAKLNEPAPVQDSEKMFTAFAEIELLFKDFNAIINICFDYMPSSIEIIQPQKLNVSNLKLSELFNDIMARLHHVDMGLKKTAARNNILERNMANLLKNAIMVYVAEPKTLAQLSKAVGIAEPELDKFLAIFAREGFIVKDGELYKKK